MIGKLFDTWAMRIAGGLAVVLAIALAIVMWRADAISAERDRLRTELATERARHAVTRQSVATLEQAIADQNAVIEERAEAYAEAQEMAEKREKQLAAARRSSDKVISRLRALAAREGQCAVPEDLRELADGL